MSSKKLVVGTLLVAGALSAGLAQARSDVQWSLSIGVPVYTQPYPIYAPAVRVYSQPAPVVVRRHGVQPTRWDVDGDGIPNRHDRVYNPRRDRDGDGIPNRYDRVYNPRWDRDGDGIPNRYDRVYNPRWDRNGAGIPSRYEPARADRDGTPDRYDGRRGR